MSDWLDDLRAISADCFMWYEHDADVETGVQSLNALSGVDPWYFHLEELDYVPVRMTREDRVAFLVRACKLHGVCLPAPRVEWMRPIRLVDRTEYARTPEDVAALRAWLEDYFTQVRVRYALAGASKGAE